MNIDYSLKFCYVISPVLSQTIQQPTGKELATLALIRAVVIFNQLNMTKFNCNISVNEFMLEKNSQTCNKV